jgi:hypothetical protein
MRNAHCRTWNLARNLKIMENEKLHTLGREVWRGKLKKGVKFRNDHCRTWNMARKLKIMENENHRLDDLKSDEITEKREK